MPGNSFPLITVTATAGSNNTRIASTAYADGAVATAVNYLKPYLGDTPPNQALYPYWLNTSDGQLYIYNQTAWMTVANFSGGNGYLPSTGGAITGNLAISGAITIVSGTIDNTVIGGTTPAAATVSSMNGGQLAGFRNRIINGSFQIDQRLEGAILTTVAANPQYCLDRWNIQTTQASKLTVVQTTSFNTANYSIPFSTGINISTPSTAYTPVAGDCFQLQQGIEGINVQDLMWGTSLAKSVTLSFYVAASVPGTYAGRLGGGSNYSYVFTYAVTNGATWVNITIPGPTVGTWGSSSGASGIVVTFDLGGGANRQTSSTNTWISGDYSATSTSVKLVSNASATLYITGVQLELGTKATPFEFRPYSTELALCQRYFEKSYAIGVKPGTVNAAGPNTTYIPGLSSSKWSVMINAPLKVPKMTTPTVVLYSYNSGASGTNYDHINNVDLSASLQFSAGNNIVSVVLLTTATTTCWTSMHWTASAEL